MLSSRTGRRPLIKLAWPIDVDRIDLFNVPLVNLSIRCPSTAEDEEDDDDDDYVGAHLHLFLREPRILLLLLSL